MRLDQITEEVRVWEIHAADQDCPEKVLGLVHVAREALDMACATFDRYCDDAS